MGRASNRHAKIFYYKKKFEGCFCVFPYLEIINKTNTRHSTHEEKKKGECLV